MSGIKGINAGQANWNYKHGATKTRLFKIWECMKERCYREKHKYFSDYGGRGIAVCDEWKRSFSAFQDWAIQNGYHDSLSIDRKDVNGDYSPENCRWVTMKAQQNNKRTNHLVCLDGVSHTITEWADILGLNKTTIKERLRSGWSDEDALTKPVRRRTKGYRPSASCGADMREVKDENHT